MKTKSFFWASYSDLMTSLFFVMLLLFVTTVTMMYIHEKATEEELATIKSLQAAVNKLDKNYFTEDQEHKRWILKQTIEFRAASTEIGDADKQYLLDCGRSLSERIDSLNEMKNSEQYKDLNVTYMVLIEGMASKDKWKYNESLSYLRALSVYDLWKSYNINFEAKGCEVQVSGSGTRGIGRYNADGLNPEEEYRNQRIIIQIIPKLGGLD